MALLLRALLAALFILTTVGGSSGATEPCRRMTLEGVTEKNVIYVVFGIGGVWELQDYEYNDFPVYKVRSGNTCSPQSFLYYICWAALSFFRQMILVMIKIVCCDKISRLNVVPTQAIWVGLPCMHATTHF